MSFDQVVFEWGTQEVTLGRLGMALLVLAAFAALAFVTAVRVGRRLLWPGTSGGQTVQMLLNVFRIKLVLIGLLVALAIVGVNVLPLVGVLLGMAAIAALSFRTSSEQIWAGLLILWERPFSLGERILVGEYEGEVERVGLRATTLRSEERMAIHVPNSYLTRHAIHNRSKTEGGFGLRIPVEVLPQYDSGEVISALRKAAERNNRVRSSPSPKAFMMGFTARGAQYELRAWVDAYSDALWARNELCRAIQSEFQRAHIQMVSEKPGAKAPAVAASGSRLRHTERDHDSSRGRERDAESPREARSERFDRPERSERSDRPERSDRSDRPDRSDRSDRSSRSRHERSSRDRRPSRDSDSRQPRRDFEQAATPAEVETAVVTESLPQPAEMESYQEISQAPELPSAPETFEAPEAPREEFYPVHEDTPPEAPAAVNTPEESTPTEEPAPTFGRSKRRVPRR